MSKLDNIEDAHRKHREDVMAANHMKNWRAWGSSVGLGLFFVEVAAAIWIIRQVF